MSRCRILCEWIHQKVRNVPVEMKREVYREYSITSHGSGDYEVDHLIPLELVRLQFNQKSLAGIPPDFAFVGVQNGFGTAFLGDSWRSSPSVLHIRVNFGTVSTQSWRFVFTDELPAVT